MASQSFFIENHYGLRLAALYDEARQEDHPPLVLVLHGHGGWKEEPHVELIAQQLAAAGISALRFDAVGSGESEGSWAEDYRLSHYIQDVSHVATWAKENLRVDPERIGVWGHSLGGCASILTAARNPNLFTALCGCQPSRGPMSIDEVELEEWKQTGFKHRSSSRFPDMRLPFAFHTDLLHFDALKDVEDINITKLFIAGARDVLVPAEGIKEMFTRAREPKRYLEFDVGHDLKHNADFLEQITSAAVTFFQESLRVEK